jgi:hypothetical protein
MESEKPMFKKNFGGYVPLPVILVFGFDIVRHLIYPACIRCIAGISDNVPVWAVVT